MADWQDSVSQEYKYQSLPSCILPSSHNSSQRDLSDKSPDTLPGSYLDKKPTHNLNTFPTTTTNNNTFLLATLGAVASTTVAAPAQAPTTAVSSANATASPGLEKRKQRSKNELKMYGECSMDGWCHLDRFLDISGLDINKMYPCSTPCQSENDTCSAVRWFEQEHIGGYPGHFWVEKVQCQGVKMPGETTALATRGAPIRERTDSSVLAPASTTTDEADEEDEADDDDDDDADADADANEDLDNDAGPDHKSATNATRVVKGANKARADGLIPTLGPWNFNTDVYYLWEHHKMEGYCDMTMNMCIFPDPPTGAEWSKYGNCDKKSPCTDEHHPCRGKGGMKADMGKNPTSHQVYCEGKNSMWMKKKERPCDIWSDLCD
ncbi:hypothetical protein B9Z65_2128 [Elsinoe australis]|uniref:Uncharacterized protein n=1 Tax=Elsinoe australis TaxID=40998 RepID=A0A2P7YN54_9PEZI|nr:hypothetical protein B9Z65_2128 [Elsinoe australis]